MRCRLRASDPAFRPHSARVLPRWDVVCLSLLCSSFFLVFKRGARLKKEANSLRSQVPAHGGGGCQGRRGVSFIGAERRPLTERARIGRSFWRRRGFAEGIR